MVAWLASDASAGVTGQVFHCAGNTVGLMSSPATVKSMNKDGRWTVDEIASVFPGTLGHELANPRPSDPPAEA